MHSSANLFKQLYDRPPFKHMHVGLFRRAITFNIQENTAGAPDARLHKRLDKLIAEFRANGDVSIVARPPIKSGSQFYREWRGKTYRVAATSEGYLYEGETYGASPGLPGSRLTVAGDRGLEPGPVEQGRPT